MQFTIIDILFLITVALLIFNGLRNGALFSLITLLTIPLGIGVAYYFGPSFTRLLASNGLPATPLISYIVLFFGTVLILHIIASSVRGVMQKIPVLGCGDSLVGGAIGFVEAWLLWLGLLFVLGTFLHDLQATIQTGSQLIPGGITVNQFVQWHDFYNNVISNSLFAQVNHFFVQRLPDLPSLPK